MANPLDGVVFVECGRCSAVSYIGDICAPTGEDPAVLRAEIAVRARGPGICPKCRLLVRLVLRRPRSAFATPEKRARYLGPNDKITVALALSVDQCGKLATADCGGCGGDGLHPVLIGQACLCVQKRLQCA